MKNDTRSNGRGNRSAHAKPGGDLRHWCEKLGCTEAELRDTVRSVMRLLANSDERHAHH